MRKIDSMTPYRNILKGLTINVMVDDGVHLASSLHFHSLSLYETSYNFLLKAARGIHFNDRHVLTSQEALGAC